MISRKVFGQPGGNKWRRALSSQSESHWKSDTYQHLQKSPVDTDYFQHSLPRLPIPKLSKTCERFLQTQKALLSQQDFNATKEVVKKFEEGEGSELDSLLRAKDAQNKGTSYISGPWSDMYLKDRRSVVFNHNPGISLASEVRPGFNDPAVRASNLLISVLRFHRSLAKKILYPDVFHMVPAKTNKPEFWNQRVRFLPSGFATQLAYLFKVFPLDMSQFPNLLQSTRIPCQVRDSIKRYPESRHIVAMKNGNFYSFDVFDKNGDIFPPSYYLGCFKKILQEKCQDSSGIGTLTSDDRDDWFRAREHLIKLGDNSTELEVIDSALFVVCFDGWNHSEEKLTETVKNLVCGPEPANRWFDKSFSLIFSQNGHVGINFEHSWGDGVAVMRLIDEIVTDSKNNSYVTPETSRDKEFAHERVKRLHFSLDDSVRSSIENARLKYFDRLSTVKFDTLQFDELGKDDCKSAKLGPDSVMQLSFQIAYHRLTGLFVPTYESCSTAIFRHGRTETLRPGTLATRACAEAFNNVGQARKNDSELMVLMQECSKTHQQLTKNAAQGQGWDRHLFSMRALAIAESRPLPQLFTDTSYININQNVLSTSTLSSINMGAGGFCAVVPNGFGLGYQIRNKDLGVITSSYLGQADGEQINESLKSTFEDIIRVIRSNAKK